MPASTRTGKPGSACTWNATTEGAAVTAAAEKLPTDERLYLQILFSANEPLPARGVAKLMGCPVEEV